MFELLRLQEVHGVRQSRGNYLAEDLVGRDVYKRQAPSTYDQKVYQFDLVTIGENSVIPDGVQVGKNTAIAGETTVGDYPDGLLASGNYIIKAGGARRCV